MMNQTVLRRVLTALWLAWLAGVAWALPPGVKATASVAGFDEYQLANGLKVVLKAQPEQPGAVLNIIYRVGSRDEGPGTTGHAHLLEHMLFKGCGDIPDVKAALQAHGIQANAMTRWDTTNYFAQVPDGGASLHWLVGLQAQCMQGATFSEASLASEMTVVRNEFEVQRSATAVTLRNAIRATAFQFHPYGRPVVGQQKDIERVDFAQLRGLYTRYYRPDNAVLVVVGAFDAPALLTHIASTFGVLPKPPKALPDLTYHEPAQAGEREITEYRVGGGGLVALAYRIPEGRHPDRHALTALGQMLARPRHGVAVQAMQAAKQGTLVALAVDNLRDPGLFQVIAQPGGTHTVWQFKDWLINHLEVNLADKLTEDELTAVQLEFDRAYEQILQHPMALAVSLTDAVAQGDWRLFFAARDGLAAVKLEDVKRVADAYLRKYNRSAAMLLSHGANVAVEWAPPPPLDEQLAAIVQRQAPVAGEVVAADPMALQARTRRWSPRPGLQLAWLDKRLPGNTAKLSITLRFAQRADLQGRFGIELMNGLLTHGSAGMAPNAMEEGLVALNSRVQFVADGQHLHISLSGPSQNLAAALQLVAAAVRQPRWDDDIFARERDGALARVPLGGSEVGPSLALMRARVVNAAGQWSKTDPQYDWVGVEGQTAWRNLSLGDLRAQHAQLWGAADVRVAALGALDAPALESALEQAFGAWQPGRPFVPSANPHVEVPPQRHHARMVDRPSGVLQALQFLPMNSSHADRWPLELGLRMFSGPMGSRLWQRLREDQGISYNVQSIFNVPRRGDRAYFGVIATYPSASQERVLQGLEQEVERVRQRGFTQAELDQARVALLAERRASYASDDALLALLDLQLDEGVGFETFARDDQFINSVSLAQVNQAFRRHVGARQWVLLTAADTGSDQGLGQSR